MTVGSVGWMGASDILDSRSRSVSSSSSWMCWGITTAVLFRGGKSMESSQQCILQTTLKEAASIVEVVRVTGNVSFYSNAAGGQDRMRRFATMRRCGDDGVASDGGCKNVC